MEIRFALDPQLDAGLIRRIEEKANGSSHNLAAKFLMRHWYENEISAIPTPERHPGDVQASNEGDILEAALDNIAADW